MYAPARHTPSKPARPTLKDDYWNGRKMKSDWGPWTLDRETNSLVMEDEHAGCYHIALESCHNSDSVLNWVAHLNEMAWTTAHIIGGFIVAVDDIIRVRAYQDGTVSRDDIRKRISYVTSSLVFHDSKKSESAVVAVGTQ